MRSSRGVLLRTFSISSPIASIHVRLNCKSRTELGAECAGMYTTRVLKGKTKHLNTFSKNRYRDGRRLERSNAAVLVEHQATAKSSGRYACEVINAEGATRCEEIYVSVNSGRKF